MTPRPVVVTGATGFVGRALCARLAGAAVPVIAVTRGPAALGPGIETRALGPVGGETPWRPALEGAGAVVHLAARAHAPPGRDEGWIAAETAAAAALARAAAAEGVARLVLVSSVKVHGETSGAGAFRAADAPAPGDAYGRAKLAVEAALREASAAGPELVVLRPPLVYGPGVKANFRALLRAVDRGLPLPLGSVTNRRSLVFLDNLLDLVELALRHPAAAGGTFLLRDDDEPSTPELVRRMARALGRKARLLPCPPALLRLAARLAGRPGAADRLLLSLSVDDRATRERLGWQPRFGLDAGLAATCRWLRGADRPAADSGPGGSPL